MIPAPGFIRQAIIVQLVGAAMGVVVLRVLAPDQPERAVGPALICLVAALGWFLLARGKLQATVLALIYGSWVAVTAMALFTGGVKAPMVIIYPLLIMLTGWLIGVRAALLLTGFTLLATLGFVAADALGTLPRYRPAKPLVQGIAQGIIYVISAVQVGFLMRGYRSHLETLGSVGTALAQRTQDLEASKTELQRAQAVAKVGSWAYSMAEDKMILSAEACRILGLPEGSTGTRADYLARVHPLDREAVTQAWVAALKGEEFDHEHRIVSGHIVHWVRQKAEFEFAPDGRVVQASGITQDVSERKLAQEKINALAYYDQLTGLPNRTLMLDRLRQAMAISDRSDIYNALLFIDLDHFKTLNDTRGHDMGDSLLKQVAQRLLDCLREGDTVARLGGDEFVVLLANLSKNMTEASIATETVAEKILAALQQSYRLGLTDQHSSASVGVTLFKGVGTSSDELMKQADLTMYRAKAAGRNMVCFYDPAMEVAVNERAALERDLRRALEAGEFLLYYQAQVVDAGRLTGAEALLRWQHPQRGMVSPAEFIPLAEETGLIVSLGRWVLETACAQLAVWAAQPNMEPLTISVNVSAHQFNQPDFVDEVLAVLDASGANPERLKLELTESLLVDNVQVIIEKMFALKAHGVGFSLDDFGTGYSSLAYLKRLPLDQLKIDQSFVRDVLIDPNDATIAKTIVALAQSLGLGVIAEGVETQAQRDALASFGCHAYQGYLFSRPVPVDAFEKLALQD